MMQSTYSLTNPKFRDRDPRSLPYYFPGRLNGVAYAKSMTAFFNNLLLEQLEQTARSLDFVVVPHDLINWSRRKKFDGLDKRYKIGQKTYFLLDPKKLTKTEVKKLQDYIADLRADMEGTA